MLSAVSIVTFVNIFALIVWGTVSDRLGRKTVLAFGLSMQAVFLFIFFVSVGSESFGLILLAMLAVLGLGQAAIVGVAPAFFAEMFETKVRMTGISMGMQLASVVGGFTPLVAASLAAGGERWTSVATISAGICLAALLAVTLRKGGRDDTEIRSVQGERDASR